MTSPKPPVVRIILCQRVKSKLSFYVESNSDSFLTGSVHYSTDNSEYDGVSDRLILSESEVGLYRFEPKYSELPPVSSSS